MLNHIIILICNFCDFAKKYYIQIIANAFRNIIDEIITQLTLNYLYCLYQIVFS